MEVLRGTIREVVALLPDDARIECVVPVKYNVGSIEAIYDVVVVLPKLEVATLTPQRKPRSQAPSQESPSAATPPRSSRSSPAKK